MCEPASLTLIAAGMSAAGTGLSALQANAQAQYAARIAERNAGMEREAAQQEILNTQEEAQAHYRRVSQIKGAQRARAAANGVGLDFGTAADMVAETDLLAREDVSRIYRQGNERLRSHDIGASNYMAEANAQRSAGNAALIGGAFNVGSTVLGGAQQYTKMRRDQVGPKVKKAA